MLKVWRGRRLTEAGGGWATVGVTQPTSSDESIQSLCRSHWYDFGMHWPFWHWNSLDKQREPLTACGQFSSSEPSPQSFSPSESGEKIGGFGDFFSFLGVWIDFCSDKNGFCGGNFQENEHFGRVLRLSFDFSWISMIFFTLLLRNLAWPFHKIRCSGNTHTTLAQILTCFLPIKIDKLGRKRTMKS